MAAAKASDYSDIDVSDKKTWLTKDKKNPENKWTDEELLYVNLNRYVHVDFLQQVRTGYADKFDGFNKMWDKMMFVYFDPAGVKCGTKELKHRIIYKLFLNRKQLKDRNALFITKTVLPTLFKEVKMDEFWSHVVTESPEDQEYLWTHLDNVLILLKKIIKFNPEKAFEGAIGMTAKERSQMLALPENKDILDLFLAHGKQNPSAVAAAKKKLNHLPSESSSQTQSQKESLHPLPAEQASLVPSEPKNPQATTANTEQAAQQQNKPKIRSRPRKQKEEDDEDDDEDSDESEDENGADAAEMKDQFSNMVGSLLNDNTFTDLMTMGEEQDKAAEGKELTPEEVEAHAKKQQGKFQGVIGKMAGGLDNLISSIAGKGGRQVSTSEREQRRARFAHVLSRVTKTPLDIHQNPDFLLEDDRAAKLEKQAMEDEETRRRTDILSHFNEELYDFLYFVYTTRAVDGMKEYSHAAPSSTGKKQFKSWETTFLLLEACFEEMETNGLTEIYLNELIKVHDDKMLRKAYRNKLTFPDLFLGLCKREDPEAVFRWKTTDPTDETKKITITYTNKYFKRLWEISPLMANLFYRVKINKIYKSYYRFPRNLKTVKSRLGSVMQFVSILANFKPGSSMEAMRPVLLSVLAANHVTPDKHNDSDQIANIMENVMNSFSTDFKIENMEKTCGDIVASGDIQRPMSMVSRMFKPELAESLGLFDPDDDSDDDDDKTDKKKDGKKKEDKKEDPKAPFNMAIFNQIGSKMFRSRDTKQVDEKGESVATFSADNNNPWNKFMQMMKKGSNGSTTNGTAADAIAPVVTAVSKSMPDSKRDDVLFLENERPKVTAQAKPKKKTLLQKQALAIQAEKLKKYEEPSEDEPVALVKVKQPKPILKPKTTAASIPKPLKTIVVRRK